MERVVVFTGAAGSGKDTAAAAVWKEFEDVASKLSFANPLKDIACNLFEWDRYEIEDLEYKEQEARWPDGSAQSIDPKTGDVRTRRQILQVLGTDCFRDLISLDVWVKKTIEHAERLEDPGDVWVVTDCRFTNEFLTLKKAAKDLIVIRVVRTDHEIAASGHASEQEWQRIPADYVIEAATGELDHIRCIALEEVGRFLEETG